MGCYFISFSIFSILNIVPDKIKNKKRKKKFIFPDMEQLITEKHASSHKIYEKHI